MDNLLENEDRTYAVRTQTKPIVRQALFILQGERQATSGEKVSMMEMAAELLEERAQEVVNTKLAGR